MEGGRPERGPEEGPLTTAIPRHPKRSGGEPIWAAHAAPHGIHCAESSCLRTPPGTGGGGRRRRPGPTHVFSTSRVTLRTGVTVSCPSPQFVPIYRHGEEDWRGGSPRGGRCVTSPVKSLTCCMPCPIVPVSYICTTNVAREVTHPCPAG